MYFAYIKCNSLAYADVTVDNFINRLTVGLFHNQPRARDMMCVTLIPVSLFSRDVIHLIYITFGRYQWNSNHLTENIEQNGIRIYFR